MVAFNNIPGNILVPFFYAEINSGGSPYEGQSRLLLVGPKLAAGSATADVPAGPIGSQADANALFGAGSVLAAMYAKARRNAPFQPIWALPLADPAGTAAEGTIVCTAPGVTGVGVLEICGVRITLQVNAADNATTVGNSVRDAINAAGLPISATAATGTVTLTFRHVGTIGNDVLVRLLTDEPNILVGHATITQLSGGTGVPDLTNALANLGDDEFDWIASPYADAVSLNTVRDFLSDTSGRWSPTKQLYGHYLTVKFDTLSGLAALGDSRNDQHVSIMGSKLASSPPWEWAAALGGQCAMHLTDAPELSRPLQTLLLDGIKPPPSRADWWDIDDRQALYVDGISAARVGNDGLVRIDRVVTTYQETAAGAADATYRDIETMAQLMFSVRYIRTFVQNRHSRQALADDNPSNLQEITTPQDIRDTLVHAYSDLVALGVLEKADLFAQFVQVERDPNNATRVNAYLPVDVVNQLRVFAANVTTFLQYAA
ncbi:phage tail sheath subtilisin-like domain-containing protein [Chelatococcus daeguensis]|uniref:Mu-like prophage tail sheath protein gpL n=1 Tax=Chelatococcus sambhunathii TaxID=363953 RepID=A0ABP2A8T2_9HYPH|nr:MULTISPECIES: phage tail sheath subtilisin-like domain-containing protein [Chelatococcus]KZE34102.1 hypothetical protein AVW15_17460 [Chelatococcus daeguensis]MBM3082659.1 phage tail sheath subtilisin-like domain-containing protein [Chelatococcus daeguensis]CUA90916.1 Mu-like prophage tail sheath protein gpL [Chelatococcus sambhunathii]